MEKGEDSQRIHVSSPERNVKFVDLTGTIHGLMMWTAYGAKVLPIGYREWAANE
jgi:hypothetical protein